MSQTAKSKIVYLVLYEGVQLLDVSGPAEVLAQANLEAGRQVYELRYVSNAANGSVRSSAGLNLATGPLPKRLTKIHTLLVPGADEKALAQAGADPQLMRWLAKAAQLATVKASVCSGAFLYGQLGLLDGYRVTTHWMGSKALQQAFPAALVEEDSLYTHDRDLWTSAGVLAGVDMTLAMVSAELGPGIALNIARVLVVFLIRDGGQSQFSGPIDLQSRAGRSDILALIAWLESELHANITVEQMAQQQATSVRTLHRRCQDALGMTPAQVLSELRLERARSLLQQLDTGVKTIALECGFTSPAAFSKAFSSRFGVAPGRYRQHFHNSKKASNQGLF